MVERGHRLMQLVSIVENGDPVCRLTEPVGCWHPDWLDHSGGQWRQEPSGTRGGRQCHTGRQASLAAM
jgi:hypothetical protein